MERRVINKEAMVDVDGSISVEADRRTIFVCPHCADIHVGLMVEGEGGGHLTVMGTWTVEEFREEYAKLMEKH